MSAEQYAESISRIALEAAKQILAALGIELGELFPDMEVSANDSLSGVDAETPSSAADETSADDDKDGAETPEAALAAFDTEKAALQARIDGLQERLENLHWGPDTPEGREIFRLEGNLAYDEARLAALTEDIADAPAEEKGTVIQQARASLAFIQESLAAAEERIGRLEGPPPF